MSNFHSLKVLDAKLETELAKTVAFEVPSELKEAYKYKPGQYLTLKFNLNGEEVRRSYSLCSSPVFDEPIRVGVKRVKGGLVSNHINDNINTGDTVEVMEPSGRFFADIKESNYKTYYLFSAGSGITPILSILRTVLETEENSYVNMIFGNMNESTIMFDDVLEELAQKYAGRFRLVHALDGVKTSKKANFKHGRVDNDMIKWFIENYHPLAQKAEYYICGPGTMIENTKKTLMSLDVPEDAIYIESFGGAKVEDDIEGVTNAKLTAKLNGETVNITVPEGKTLLRALIGEGKEPPFSCEGGVCSTCLCKVKKGKVHMKNNWSLDEKEEIADGYALSCQSIPMTEEVEIEYQ